MKGKLSGGATARAHSRPAAQTALWARRLGACTWEPASRRLMHGTEEVRLSPQERSLLEYFIANAGRALTRDTLLRAIARRSPRTGTRTVDQVVKNLRARIEPDPRRPMLLVSVREVGYRFEP